MKVLLAVDGSDQSMKAVHWTLETLGEKARITLFGVIVFAQDLLREMPPNIQDKLRTENEAALNRAKEVFDAGGVAVEMILETGISPANSIIEKAQDGDFDLIVLGSHGIGGLKRTLMGSTASKVAAHAPCSITIIR